MTREPQTPAQRRLVHQLTNEPLIHERLLRYPAIRRTFPWAAIDACKDKPPYFCHFMGWRLGTWGEESHFERLNTLLELAEQMENWENERVRVGSSDYGEFWSLYWTLQVAQLLHGEGLKPRWMKEGPDLQVADGWYVECYTLRKSFAIYNFIEELLSALHPDLRASYQKCLRFNLPQDSKRESFLNEALRSVSDPEDVQDATERAKSEYPDVLYKHPGSTLVIYAEGHDSNAYVPNKVPSTAGSPESYARVVLNEIANAKLGRNALKRHRPNIVAANLLLSIDWQMRDHSTLVRDWEEASEDHKSEIDALVVATAGIDCMLEKDDLAPVWCRKEARQVAEALTGRLARIEQL